MDADTHTLIAHALEESRQFIINTEHGINTMMNVPMRATPTDKKTCHTFLIDLLHDAINAHNGQH